MCVCMQGVWSPASWTQRCIDLDVLKGVPRQQEVDEEVGKRQLQLHWPVQGPQVPWPAGMLDDVVVSYRVPTTQ